MILNDYILSKNNPHLIGGFVYMGVKQIIMKIESFLVEKPKYKLTWCSDDFEKGKRWAKTQPHPFLKNRTLWDLCEDRSSSIYTIDNLNKFLFNEI